MVTGNHQTVMHSFQHFISELYKVKFLKIKFHLQQI